MPRQRPISWMKAAQKQLEEFPLEVRIDIETSLIVAARGGKSDTAKPLKGLDGGVFEIAVKHRGDAFRAIYAVQVSAALGNRRIAEEIEERNRNPAGGRGAHQIATEAAEQALR
jgi:phage-related protein